MSEEHISLVRNQSSHDIEHLSNSKLMDSSKAVDSNEWNEIDIEQEQEQRLDKDEHPLNVALDEDPWAVENIGSSSNQVVLEEEEENTLLPVEQEEVTAKGIDGVATTTVFDVINDDDSRTKTVQEEDGEEQLDQDTSPIKGFQNFETSDKIDDLTVSGKLPEWLIGEYFTVGPATFDIKYQRKIEIDGELQNASALYSFGHVFDCLPVVQRMDLNGTRNIVTYRNRATSKRLVEKIRDNHGYAPQHPAGLYMSNTNQTVLSKLLPNKQNTRADAEPCGARVLCSIPGLDGSLFAQNYANHIQELDPFDLKPSRLLTWNEINPKFKGTSSCPNGQFDPRTGEYINFLMEVGYQSVKYNFFSISDKERGGRLIASVTAPMAYVNTFSITPKYIIFVICPLLANANGVKYNWNESIMDSFTFCANEPTLFYVISRERGTVVATYRSDPCFVLNHINAFEDPINLDHVYIDMICYPDDTITRQLVPEYLRNPSIMNPPRLIASEVRRYTLANIEQENLVYLTNNLSIPSKMSVTKSISSVFGFMSKPSKSRNNQDSNLEYDSGSGSKKWYSWIPIASFDKRVQPSIEFPTMNPKFKLKKYAFMYGLGFSATSSLKDGAIWDSIVKTNLDSKQITASWHQDFCYPSEAVFVPRPSIGPEDEVGEDEGVLLSIVLNSAKSSSFLLVLDATTLHVLATANLKRLVPPSYTHGSCRIRED